MWFFDLDDYLHTSLDDADAYTDEMIEKFIDKSAFGYNVDLAYILNILFNVLAFLFSMYVLKLELWQMPLAMVVTDIFLVFFEKLSLKYHTFCYNWVLNTTKFEKYIEKLSVAKKKYTEALINCNSYSHRYEYQILKMQIDTIDSLLKELQKKSKELQETKQMETDIVKKKEITTVREYREKLEELQTEDIMALPKKYKKYVDTVLKNSTELLDELDKNTAAFDLVHNTFNIYLSETISAIKQISKLDVEQQEVHKPILEEIVIEYTKHIERLKERVRSYNTTSINANLTTLLTELKQEGDK